MKVPNPLWRLEYDRDHWTSGARARAAAITLYDLSKHDT
jgi:hypothetical protein